MFEEENEINQEETRDERNACPQCGIRQYGNVCANCQTEIEPEEDPDKRKEDEYDEYDYRERR